jgi:DNA-binding SARP family transcriptional activator
VEFGLLGPLVVRAGGSRVTVTAGKQRVLLAALLLRANQVVPAADLAGFIWEGGPPGTARVTLQNYVKRLRHALGPAGPERIVTRPAGYLMEVRPGELDVARFGELVSGGLAAARAGVWARASAQLGAGLAGGGGGFGGGGAAGGCAVAGAGGGGGAAAGGDAAGCGGGAD